MENKKAQVGSAPSLASQLFGSLESSSSSNDVFASIFPPPKGVGRNSASEVTGSWQKEPSRTGNHPWNTRQDNTYKHGDPCHFSSSLYYGGREIYSHSTSHSTSSSSYPTLKKDGDDDASGAARGNWWQGSLYY